MQAFQKNHFFPLLVFTLLLFISGTGMAQIIPTTSDTSQTIVKVWPDDPLGRRNPKGTVEGFLSAVAAKNYDTAALYLQIDPKLKKQADREKLALALQSLLEKNGKIYPYSWISHEAEGIKDDNLGPNLDLVGVASVDNKSFDLILESTKDTMGGPIWLFSSQTLQNVPIDSAIVQEATLVEKVSPKVFEENLWGGVPAAHWLAMLIIVIAAYVIAGLIIRLIVFVLPKLWKRAREESAAGIIQSFVLPIQLYLAVWIFVVASRVAGISLIVRQQFKDLTVIVGLVAFILLLWQLIDFIAKLLERKMLQVGNQSGMSAVLFLRRAAKIALVVMAVILILDTFGFNVTTWLTALGIGGIALALGTQKTVENFVGSVTIIADHPIRVGDYCKAGTVQGTVERIGMRTTLIRTVDRTIVSIPNGELAATKIENFASRERFLFHPTLGLRYETTPAQIRELLITIKSALLEEPKIIPDSARVRFIALGNTSLDLEVFAYIDTKDNDEFLEIQEKLLLDFMDIIEKSGTGLAFPSQTVYVAEDTGVKKDTT